jgi:two-component system, NtrC family, response regulator AtoC
VAEPQASILVVDDDVALARVLCALLAQGGFKASTVGDANAALAVLGKGGVDLVLTDVRMPGMDGFGLLAAVKERFTEVPVVLMTAHGSVPMAVDAMKQGASDFVLKPFEREDLLAVVARVLQISAVDRQAPPKRAAAAGSGLFGNTPAMLEAKELITRAAASNATVLLRGESGTGKEVAAREIHRQSARARAPFIAVNCAALTDELLVSELFGYEAGAFTSSTKEGKPGRVELAESGTLFLDEIGDISPKTQVTLLRLLQEKTFERTGAGARTRKADVRFIVASHQPLEKLVEEKKFREDLFYRLNVVPIFMPPLRERRADIVPLATMFCQTFAKENGRPNTSLDTGALGRLEAQEWKGNVRQLQNFIERLVVLTTSDVITAADVDRELGRGVAGPSSATSANGPSSGATSLDDRRRETERAAIEDAIRRSNGNRTRAALLLNISRRTLYNKMEALGMKPEE